jgi:alpha,alpha-trehalose phosphorylase
LLNYLPLTLYRYQVCKQANTVLAHFLLEDEQDFETIKNSYDYFNETARLDLDNTHGNTKDGLHMANMGGTWLAIVYGFAGLRVKECGLSLAPSLPKEWNSIDFHLQYQGRLLKFHMDGTAVTYLVVEGDALTISHNGDSIYLENGIEVKFSNI